MVKILRALDNRYTNIIQTMDIFETTKRVLIFMELATNGTLFEFLDRSKDMIAETQVNS
jgi:serine/threonine protein kinase